MATERQIMDQVYDEAEKIHAAIREAEDRLEKLCKGQSGTFRIHARTTFVRHVKQGIVVKQEARKPKAPAAPTQLKATGTGV